MAETEIEEIDLIAEVEAEEVSNQDKCTRQNVLSAVKIVKFHSSQQKESLFTAENATIKEEISKF
jgi:hypothetical protein